MCKDAATLRGVDCDALKFIAFDAGDAVVCSERFVDERVIGIEEIHDAAVFLDDVIEKVLRLPLHRGEKFRRTVGSL